MIDWTKPIRTKDGRPARLLGTIKDRRYPKCVALLMIDDTEIVKIFTEAGNLYSSGEPSVSDLKNVPVKHVAYLNIYADGVASHLNRAVADAYAWPGLQRIACIRVEYTEGQYDD